MTRSKTRKPRKSPTTKAKKCAVPECDRPSYARGLCQTHHRQLMTTGKLGSIRPYRQRQAGTVKLCGLRLTPGCAEMLEQVAKERDLSYGALIAEILEAWNNRRKS
jgi:hypothetical protein